VVVFLVSSALHKFYILPLTPLPPPIFFFFPEKRIEISLKEPSKWGGVAKSFQHINEQQAPTALSRSLFFMPNPHKGSISNHTALFGPKPFFLLPYCSSTCNKIHRKENTEFERRWSVNLKRCDREGVGPAPLEKSEFPSESQP
jgi:hypothetical protein